MSVPDIFTLFSFSLKTTVIEPDTYPGIIQLPKFPFATG